VLTAGLLAAVPFWHAWSRLRRPALQKIAIVYTAVDVLLVGLLSVTPSPPPDGSSGNSALSTIGGFGVLAVVIVACIQLRGIRREVYALPTVVPALADPVMARALAGRQRRDEARRMWTSDPSLANELGVGRPDLRRGFDDGGLIDVNNAPAAAFAQVCGIDVQLAETIVGTRERLGRTYYNVEELFIDVPLPHHVQQLLIDRAVI
jgi:hypothetical protein